MSLQRAVRRTLAVLGVALAAAVIVPAAWAHPYTAAISPTSAGTGDKDAYSYTFTNKWTGSQKATKAEIAIPSGWVVSPSDLGAPTAGDGTWSAALSGGKIVLTATSGGLGYNKSLSVTFAGKATCTVGSSKWVPKLTRGSTVWDLSNTTPAVAVTKPGRLDHFTWTTQPGATQTAGVAFGATATALDACNNTKTNYGGAGTVTGDANPAPDGTLPTYAVSWAQGVGTVTARAFKAEDGRSLKVKDGAVEATSSTFKVVPGELGSFTLAPISDQVAGASFGVVATAFDKWLNLKTNYAGGAAVTGTFGPAPDGTAPSYGAFGAPVDGTATAAVTLFNAETGTVTVADGAVTKTSGQFSVVPGPVEELVFTQQPSTSEVAPALIAPPVVVAAFDDWQNAATNAVANVALTLSPNPGSLGGGSAPLVAGSAAFSSLSVGLVGAGYRLTASYPGAADELSGPFDIANDVTPCAGSGCSGSATSSNGQSTATNVSGTLPPGTLLTTTFLTSGPPSGACSDFTPLGVGTEVIVTGGTPSLTITYIVPSNLLPGWKPGWAFNVCLGSKPLTSGVSPWLTKYLDLSTLPWKRKPAIPNGDTYWGVAPSCAFADGEPLPWFPIPATNPCVVSKSRSGFLGLFGDLTMVVRVPYPWDPKGFVG